jgi:hypothetical protein
MMKRASSFVVKKEKKGAMPRGRGSIFSSDNELRAQLASQLGGPGTSRPARSGSFISDIAAASELDGQVVVEALEEESEDDEK